MADSSGNLAAHLPPEVLDRYEVRSYRNAAQLLSTSAAAEHADLLTALRSFSLTTADIRKPGGNESDIPKRLAEVLRPRGWQETRIKGDLHITKLTGQPPRARVGDGDDEAAFETADPNQLRREGVPVEQIVRRNFLDGHKVDFIKGRVAFDVEWNSKDQTFDRDLYAFRAFYECDLIDVAVVLTRSGDLNQVLTGSARNSTKTATHAWTRPGSPRCSRASMARARPGWVNWSTGWRPAGRVGARC